MTDTAGKRGQAPPEQLARTPIQKEGRVLISELFMLVRTVQIYDPHNQALERPLKKFRSHLNRCIQALGALTLTRVGEDLYLNGERVRVDFRELAYVRYLSSEFRRRDLSEVSFQKEASLEELRRFLRLFAMDTDKEEGAAGIASIHVVRHREYRAESSTSHLMDRREYALRVYTKAILFLRDFVNTMAQGNVPPARRAQRIIQDLVDMSFEDLFLLLGLATIRGYGEYLYHHCVNATLLAICVGQRLGLSKQRLGELGMCALFYDIGTVDVPLEILRKPDRLTAVEREIVKNHSLYTVRNLLSVKGFSEEKIKQMIVAFEHHLPYKPKSAAQDPPRHRLHLYSQIVAIVDAYDSLTTDRPFRDAYLPDEALRLLMRDGGTKFSPLLVKVFVNLMGMYPVGTLVCLDTGEVGVVFHTNADPKRYDRPILKMVLDANGKRLPGSLVDLTEADSGAGSYPRSIQASINPYEWGINVSHYLLM